MAYIDYKEELMHQKFIAEQVLARKDLSYAVREAWEKKMEHCNTMLNFMQKR